VLRYGPEGEIAIAPFVNITFNQPMVPLTTLEELSSEQVPVRLDPALPGTWRWIGAKTLTFQYDSDLIDRLPKATHYQVSIPAGTRSATGRCAGSGCGMVFFHPSGPGGYKLPL
jgi:alpha-2-macroglobulin